MGLEFSGEIWHWKGPPLKADVRRAEDLEVGATTTVRLFIDA